MLWTFLEGLCRAGCQAGCRVQGHCTSSVFKDLTSREGGRLKGGIAADVIGDMTSVLGGQETLPQSSDILAGYQRRHRNSLG